VLQPILDHSAFRAHSAARSTDRETIVCLGGSATAGGGGIPLHSQYPYLIAKRHTQWHVYNRAHGASDTLWASLMFDSLVPVDASVIVWEFAINDVGFVKGPGGQQLELDVFRRFMHQVRAHPSNPLVVFVFLWDAPFRIPPQQTIFHALRAELPADALVVNAAAMVKEECNLRAANASCATHHTYKHLGRADQVSAHDVSAPAAACKATTPPPRPPSP